MIRIIYGICFLVLGTGLPCLAKNTGVDHLLPSPTAKAGNKSTATLPAPALAKEKTPIRKESKVSKTENASHGAVSPALAAKQALAAGLPSSPAIRDGHLPSSSPGLSDKHSSTIVYADGAAPVQTEFGSLTTRLEADRTSAERRLARVTAYWAAEGDYYTERCIAATGVRLHDGHCAVDPSIIPYGSVVDIAGVGRFLAVDTGSAVISRTAAREGGHTAAERHAIVIDLFFQNRRKGEEFAAGAAKYVAISWWTPSSMGLAARAARDFFAEEDWTKIQSKQL